MRSIFAILTCAAWLAGCGDTGDTSGSGGGGGGGGAGGGATDGGGGAGGMSASARRVFVTAAPILPDLGGTTGGDAACQAAADAAALGGTWLAWLSDATSSPSVRFTPFDGPYVLVDGTAVASSFTALTSEDLMHAIDLDEDGAPVASSEVWTATDRAGIHDLSAACDGWTSTAVGSVGGVGLTSSTSPTWSNAYLQTCDHTELRLYCFEQ